MSSLRSDDTRNLLDIIDTLRAQGIGNYIDLPQIIVCGEQSSGKSSVLEAISGLTFPTKDAVCTRFATEVILRRNESKRRKISIVPGTQENHDVSSLKKLRSVDIDEAEDDGWVDLGQVIEEAKLAMGIVEGGKTFSSDILRIELCGPGQPHLTLVDLPGLYQSGSKGQSVADSKTVKSLVTAYMENHRSIILAVVSAKNDFNNQIITSLATKIDSSGQRTLGLITKPDQLHPGTDSERFYIKLAQNLEVNFALGWHVLRNRDVPEKDMTLEERNAMEKEFFRSGAWRSLPPSQLGVEALKPRLSKGLKDHIVSQLPSVLSQIEDGVAECEAGLQRLGSARETIRDQRQYLLTVSTQFTDLIKGAMNGSYYNKFFGDAATDDGYARRLRAVIQNTLAEFADNMRRHGHVFEIIDSDYDAETWGTGQQVITRSKYLDKVAALLRRTRGRELSGLFDPLIVGDLFSEQSQPWKGLISNMIDAVIDLTYAVIHAVLSHTLDERTRDGVLTHIVNTGFDKLKSALRQKVEEVMAPHLERHPITMNDYLTETVQKIQMKRREEQIKSILSSSLGSTALLHGMKVRLEVNPKDLLERLTSTMEMTMESYASSTATDFMQAYYKVALETVVDNISTLAIEECLIQPAPSLFCPQTIFDLEDGTISAIAAEDATNAAERARLNSKLDVLEKGLRELKKFQSLKPSATNDHLGQFTSAMANGLANGKENSASESEAAHDPTPDSPKVSPAIVTMPIATPKAVEQVDTPSAEANIDFDGWGTMTVTTNSMKKKKKDRIRSAPRGVPAPSASLGIGCHPEHVHDADEWGGQEELV